jgi:hypothetical protein
VFIIPILAFTMSDPGVHVQPIRAFTFDRHAHVRVYLLLRAHASLRSRAERMRRFHTAESGQKT